MNSLENLLVQILEVEHINEPQYTQGLNYMYVQVFIK